MPVMTVCAPKLALTQAVFTSSRGQVPAERNFLDFLGQYMQVERVRDTGRTPLVDDTCFYKESAAGRMNTVIVCYRNNSIIKIFQCCRWLA
ncbi:hypothetical protein [Polaromonas sp.]|uniref:hypothetical protein n=1 Tax=Polaromonas sp. TaxID=1869339 RepID=UPI0017C5042B|nr:hypothetical protein [Polaromonas sp.]NML86094.1 hypothetical protein [Polaromonas sp.]